MDTEDNTATNEAGDDLPVELTLSNVLIGVVTVLLLGVGYLVLFAPGKKQKEEALVSVLTMVKSIICHMISHSLLLKTHSFYYKLKLNF